MSAQRLTDNDPLEIPAFETIPSNGTVREETGSHETEAQKTLKPTAKCFALMGAKGGVGTTSLSVQLAYSFSSENRNSLKSGSAIKNPRVCLIDLDFGTGSCAHHLDLSPGLTLQDLTRRPQDVDRAFMAALVSTHQSGIDLLAAPNSLLGNERVNPETVTAMLDVTSQLYDYLVIDVPRIWRPWNAAAIMGADRFAIVTEPSVPALHLARREIEEIEALCDMTEPCDVILNRYERRAFRNSLREKDAARALGRDITATLCIDVNTLTEASNCGVPAGVINSDARYVKDVRILTTRWLESLNTAQHIAA